MRTPWYGARYHSYQGAPPGWAEWGVRSRMGMLGELLGQVEGMRLPPVVAQPTESQCLVIKTRCVLVADVIEIGPDGTRNTVLSGLDDQVARDVYRELTGRPWTRAEAR